MLLFLYRRSGFDIRKRVQGAGLALMRALASVFEPCVLAPVPVKATVRKSNSGPAEHR